MSRWPIFLALGFLLLASFLGGAAETRADPALPSFRSVQSGPWSDPATWGHTGLPQPDVTIPGPNSRVTIAQGTTVTLAETMYRLDALTVGDGARLQGEMGASVDLRVRADIDNAGLILGGAGGAQGPAGAVRLESEAGHIENNGLIWGGDAGTSDGPGGAVVLVVHGSSVANRGDIRGGRGGRGFPGGAVMLDAPQGVIRNQGEIRGGYGGPGGRGGDVQLWAATVDTSEGRILGGSSPESVYGEVTLGAENAVLASGRRTRFSGRRLSVAVADGVLDLHNLETMGILGQPGDVWLVGQPGARLDLTANQARFPPVQVPEGQAHVWFDAEQRFLDKGMPWTAVISGTLDLANGRALALPRVRLLRWQEGRPGDTLYWQADVVNLGNAAAPVQVQVKDARRWSVHLDAPAARVLSPGGHWPLTVTVTIPVTASLGTRDVVTLTARAGTEAPLQDAYALPLAVRGRPLYLPWVGRQAVWRASRRAVVLAPRAQALHVELTWPGAKQGRGLAGRALLLVVNRGGGTDVVGGDIAYWDGSHWVPLATTSDMENLVEDGIWSAFWDTGEIPLTSVYLRARLWTASGQVGEVVRSVIIHHAPMAQARATFESGGKVLLDATGSTDLDQDIREYRWDMGNGHVLEGAQVEYAFTPGVHTIRLVVTDAEGLSDEAVYRLDTTTAAWKEQTGCGCQSLHLLTSGTSPLPLPWEDVTHSRLGVDVDPLGRGRMARLNLGVSVSLTPDSNVRYCRVAQLGRLSWQWTQNGSPHSGTWKWAGQSFPASAQSWGMIGETRPSSLMVGRGETLQWVLGLGWGWRGVNQGLPEAVLAEQGMRLVGTYRAQVSGPDGSCACTWMVTVHIPATGAPTVDVQSSCP